MLLFILVPGDVGDGVLGDEVLEGVVGVVQVAGVGGTHDSYR